MCLKFLYTDLYRICLVSQKNVNIFILICVEIYNVLKKPKRKHRRGENSTIHHAKLGVRKVYQIFIYIFL